MKVKKSVFQDMTDIERQYQVKKWGVQHHTDEKWGMILLEEVGELAKAVLEKNESNILTEMVQVAAVLETWVTSREFY